jgi:hypothetical protein
MMLQALQLVCFLLHLRNLNQVWYTHKHSNDADDLIVGSPLSLWVAKARLETESKLKD